MVIVEYHYTNSHHKWVRYFTSLIEYMKYIQPLMPYIEVLSVKEK